MKRFTENRAAWLVPLLCLALIPRPAAAYLDPSTGSLALQIVMGGFLAGVAAVKLGWRRVRGLFGPRKDGPDAEG
jgi:hypothetical protein